MTAAPAKDASQSVSPKQGGARQETANMSESKDRPETTKTQQNGKAKEKPAPGSAKDPLRPRRKKARRACFACQRAHLTCGTSRLPRKFHSRHRSVLIQYRR